MGETEARADGADPAGGADGDTDDPAPVAVVGDTAASTAASTGSPMADVMAEMPGVWRRLLAAHVPDRLGRCRGCRSDTGSGERWPCSLHRIATEARRLHDRKLEQAIDSD